MSGSERSNDQMSLPGFGVPTDFMTGERLSPVKLVRITKLKDAEREFRALLHELDGTSVGSRPGDRRMALAFTKLDETVMWSVASILDHYGG